MIGEVTGIGVERAKPLQRSEGHKQEAAAKPGMEEPVDKVTLNEKEDEPVTYAKPSVEQGLSAKFLMLRELVAQMFKDQGLATVIDTGGENTIDIAKMTPEEAKALVADDGYWGVDKTSDRIVAFATGVAGNDVSKLEEIKSGVMKGFEMAKKDFGMALPEISQKTIDAVMEKLDKWAEEIKAHAASSAAAPSDVD